MLSLLSSDLTPSFDFFVNQCLSSHISHVLASSHFTDEDIELRRGHHLPQVQGDERLQSSFPFPVLPTGPDSLLEPLHPS